MSFPKPIRGSALLERRERQAAHKAREAAVMQDAKRRDGGKCRVPRCVYAKRDLPIDACHWQHRGMGGNPKEDRTTRETVISLCRFHHGQYDKGFIDIEPLTPQAFDGPAAFYEYTGQGRRECIGVEKVIGVSETRTA